MAAYQVNDGEKETTEDDIPAIMRRKTRPNSFMYVENIPIFQSLAKDTGAEFAYTIACSSWLTPGSATDALNDDNSIITLSEAAAERIQVFRGDTVIVRGRLRKETLLIVLVDNEVDDTYAAMNRVVRRNLRVYLGDVVSVYPCPNIQYAKRVALLPYADTIEGISGSLFEEFFAPYFREAYRPVRKGDSFTIRASRQMIEVLVVEVDPPDYGIVDGDTVIHCEGDPIMRDDKSANDIGYSDIGGYQKELAQIREMVELPLRHPLLFKIAGVDPPRGILLHGPPGIGKSRIARAVINETGSFTFFVDGIELLASGKFKEYLRIAFEKAEEQSPSVIVIENVDLIAPKRDRMEGNDEQLIRSSVVINSIDSLKSSNVVIIGTTTNLENIDPALRRFGRLGYEVGLGAPDLAGRLEILRIHTRDMKLANDVDLEQLAGQTQGYVGSDLTALCFIASMQQIREILPLIDIDDDGIYAEVLDLITVNMKNFESALGFVVERNT